MLVTNGAKMKFCSYCYLPSETLLRCGKCQKRLFCSRECQRKDWTNAAHRLSCGDAGEIDVDYEVRDAGPGVGLGLFALRNFRKNERLLVERPLFKVPSGSLHFPDIPAAARKAVDALLPVEGSLLQKVNRNGMSCTDVSEGRGETGLFLIMSRMNHHCLGNADHQYIPHRGVKIAVANRDIAAGEEVTISYIAYAPRDQRRARLAFDYGIDCTCSVCQDSELEMQLARAKELDDEIMETASSGKIEVALRKGVALLRIYDELQFSSWSYQRTYYDLFQVAITKKKYVEKGRRFIRQAYEALLAYTGDEHHPNVQRFKALIASPQDHRNYLILN